MLLILTCLFFIYEYTYTLRVLIEIKLGLLYGKQTDMNLNMTTYSKNKFQYFLKTLKLNPIVLFISIRFLQKLVTEVEFYNETSPTKQQL